MKTVTYTDPDSSTSRFVVKVDGKRHRFASGEKTEVADNVAAAVKKAAPEGTVTIADAPSAGASEKKKDD